MLSVFFFNDTATTEFYTLSLHDALPILRLASSMNAAVSARFADAARFSTMRRWPLRIRSEEHTSELQSRENLVCRLLLEKKKHLRLRRGSALDACRLRCDGTVPGRHARA